MTPELAAALRAPFPAELVGKLPRIWCGACREAKTRTCTEHRKERCGGCANNITSAHIHLDYVGHADVTDRLLSVDPGWTWEPLAFDERGLPAADGNGGLWIRLTVAGVTRLGYGHADGKRGGDAVKEVIGDAIRNAALRFGVAIDLWRKEPPPAHEDTTSAKPARKAAPRRTSTPDDKPADEVELKRLRNWMFALYREEDQDSDDPVAKREGRLADLSAIVGRAVRSSSDLTVAELRRVIGSLEDRQRERQGATDG